MFNKFLKIKLTDTDSVVSKGTYTPRSYRHKINTQSTIGTQRKRKSAKANVLKNALPGEPKKIPPTTFVDITAMHGNFCTKFYTVVKRSNIHFVTKFY